MKRLFCVTNEDGVAFAVLAENEERALERVSTDPRNEAFANGNRGADVVEVAFLNLGATETTDPTDEWTGQDEQGNTVALAWVR